MKDREKLLSHLLSLREMRLREEVATLKSHAATRERVQRGLDAARDSAAETIASASALRDLGLIGEARAVSMARVNATTLKIREASDRVSAAQRRAEAIRTAKAQLTKARALAQDQSHEHDNEQFQAWKRSFEPRR